MFLSIVLVAHSAEIKSISFQDLAGNLYSNVTVLKLEKDGVLFRYGEEPRYGRVKFTNMTEEVQLKCGYDAKKIEQDREEKAAKAKLDRERYAEARARKEADEVTRLVSLVTPITVADFPKTDATKAACKEIAAELKGIHTAIELGVSYNKFSELLTDTAITVQKAKDLRGDNLPAVFLIRADKCIDAYNQSRDFWRKSIDTESERAKAMSDYYRRESWAKAGINLTFCIGIAESRTNVNELVISQAIEMIESEKRAFEKGNLSLGLLDYSALSLMTKDQILDRLKESLAK